MALHAADHDHDGSGRPLLTAEATDHLDTMRRTLEERPVFILEACEELDPDQLAAAVTGEDGAALLALFRKAIATKREYTVEQTLRRLAPGAAETDALAHLARLYA